MQTPQSEAGSRPAKRMRLGTKSCAECRRRKVRCIFESNATVCKGCALHETPCTSQQSKSHGSSSSGKDDGNVQQRIQDLEGMVRHICKALDIDMESLTLAEFEVKTAEALKCLRRASSLETMAVENRLTSPNYSPPESLNPTEPQGRRLAHGSTNHHEDAPLIGLFKEAMLIEKSNVYDDRGQPDLSLDQRFDTCIANLKSLIPTLSDLTIILDVTQKYWPIWPVSPKDSETFLDRHQQWGPVTARDFILDSLESGVPTLVAKSVLWLSLCIQQLPKQFKNLGTLPALPNTMLASFLSGAETLLAIDEDLGGSIEGLECGMLLMKLYINMGKPRKAWLSMRRATSFALILGIHGQKFDSDSHSRSLWSQIWQTERHLALTLGLPCALPDSHPGLSPSQMGYSIINRFMYELSIISGHIIDRDQNHKKADYSVTVQIDQELERCKQGIPQDWWDAVPSDSMSLEELYHRVVVKMYYHQLCKFLHLPYMLKSSQNRKFENSRISTLEACREMIKCYQTLRGTRGSELMICDVMDFQIFSATIVIVIDLLSRSSTPKTSQDDEDWALVKGVTRCVKWFSQEMGCTVASQSAQLLEYLSTVPDGTASNPDGYEAVIPYFGKVRINPISTTQTQTTLPFGQQPARPSNTIEFSVNSFLPFGQNLNADYLVDAELGVDWTAILDPDLSYDWSQTFDPAASNFQA
ncbi:hypothetical protein G7Y89_g14136 [Cudoniella acicularis]|uniref:Zn(2)-C6 fungal-type domain-containing protein n=1 Tax=Cudoniella acicularis TaxID=354080 RepID=A0A8H4R9B4_9HELO|nr:hypothetical protein G7Y89_g14136 [Cudoniella acicularis]